MPSTRSLNPSLLAPMWGLLFSKCFILEFCVQNYEMPINSIAYIWLPSIGMASAATFVYGQLNLVGLSPRALFRGIEQHSKAKLIALILSSTLLLTTIIRLETYLLCLSLSWCIIDLLKYMRTKQKIHLYCSIGWSSCTAAIGFFTMPFTLLAFGLGILSFISIPEFTIYAQNRRQGRLI